jgi:hypothetical protein
MTALEIKMKILEDDRWLYRAIYVIYERQTQNEKVRRETVEDNGVGFNGVDGRAMSRIAETLIKHKTLSSYDKKIARDRMVKYVNQLLTLTKEKQS